MPNPSTHVVTYEPVPDAVHTQVQRAVCSCGWTGPPRNLHEPHQDAFMRLDGSEHRASRGLPW